MYDIRPNLLIGFHGCDASICHDLINKPDKVKLSKEPKLIDLLEGRADSIGVFQDLA